MSGALRWHELPLEVLAQRFWANGSFALTGAHRVSVYLAAGVMPGPDEFACHHCDNPPCVNPAHLFVGSHMDNVRDRVAKHRGPCCAKGHPYDEANTLWTSKGWRYCRTCKNARNREFMRTYARKGVAS